MSKTYLKPAPEPPAIRDAMARASRRQERGEPVYDFSSGNIGRLLMEYNPFQDISVDTGRMPESFEPVAKALARGMQKAFAGKPQGLSYSPTGGTEAQRRTAIQYFKKIHGVPLSEEDTHKVMITVGGQQSMAAALRSLSPEAKVIAPRWDYAPVTGIASDEPWEFCKLSPQDGLGFSLDDLREEATDGAVFYTSMPNNPSGYVSAEKLRKAAEIMVQAGGGVIWDAPYLFTMFRIIGGQAKFDPDFLENQVEKFAVVAEEFSENMCITSSLSKSCLIAGLRFGFATAPPDWIQNMEAIVGRENLSSPTASFIMGDEVFQAFLEEEVYTYQWASEILVDRVNYLLEREIPLILPDNGKFGALYVLVEAPERGNSYAEKLGQQGVISVTAEPFYGKAVDAVRLSLVAVPYVEEDRLWKENVDKLAAVVGEL